MSALATASIFLIAVGLLFFLPGFILLSVFFSRRFPLTSFETLLFSFALGIGLTDVLMLSLNRGNILFTPLSLALGMLFILIVLFGMYRLLHPPAHTPPVQDTVFVLSRRQGWLFITLIALTVLIKSVYLMHAVLPTSTDLGHHMYWSKLIAVTGKIPLYAKQEIITSPFGYQITAPQPIADFIIGEHLPFAAINIFTGLDFLTAFPVIFLLLINILGLIALFVLAFSLAAGIKNHSPFTDALTPTNVALATLFLFGPLYTLASPQAKFVSGGVVGNTLGNFFIPLIILAFYRAFKEKRPDFFSLGFFLTLVLAYTHHLSTLILLFVLMAAALIFLFSHIRNLREALRSWWSIVFSPAPILTLLFGCVFFLTIAMPTYIETETISTALGSPTKATRTGLTFLQVTFSSGEARVALGLAGLAFLLLLAPLKRSASAFLLGWAGILLIMTFEPGWLFIDIPSNRIGSYLSFPLGILAALAAITLLSSLQTPLSRFRLPHTLVLLLGFTLFAFSLGSGSFDNNQTLLPKSKAQSALQTFSASHYLAETSALDTLIVKDHNYIVADAWMKLFFLRDYAYPLSRGFFKRYEGNPSREQCTLLMISVPNTERGEKCYQDLGVDLVVVNPSFDTAQFEKSLKFSRVYASENIHIYARKK